MASILSPDAALSITWLYMNEIRKEMSITRREDNSTIPNLII